MRVKAAAGTYPVHANLHQIKMVTSPYLFLLLIGSARNLYPFGLPVCVSAPYSTMLLRIIRCAKKSRVSQPKISQKYGNFTKRPLRCAQGFDWNVSCGGMPCTPEHPEETVTASENISTHNIVTINNNVVSLQ